MLAERTAPTIETLTVGDVIHKKGTSFTVLLPPQKGRRFTWVWGQWSDGDVRAHMVRSLARNAVSVESGVLTPEQEEIAANLLVARQKHMDRLAEIQRWEDELADSYCGRLESKWIR